MTGPVHHRIPLLMYGILLVCLGIAMYLFGVLIALPRHLLDGGERLLAFNEWIVWYSGMPLMLGLGLAIVDLFLLFKNKRSPQLEVRYDPIADPRLVVALTAYDDEASIADAVRDFRSHPLVDEVIVVSNNSRDNTLERAREAGATAVDELQQGYGRCVYRCFQEAIARGKELIVLCEGDRTFRAYDLDKFLAYAPHADIVNGTRTVERLRARHAAQHVYLLWQPVRWKAARGKAPWPEHDHRCRHDLQTLPSRSAHSADVALETDRKPGI